MPLGGQLRLKLEQAPDFSRDRFIVSAPNHEAAQTLDSWPAGAGGTLALIGPAGVGKTHLATAWARRTQAETIAVDALGRDRRGETAGAMVLDGADAVAHGEGFFHLLNKAAQPGNALLLTGRSPPRTWAVEVQDLRSRLNALPLITIGEPDDAILRGVLVKLFKDRNIRPPHDLLAYLLRRMERSAPAAQAVVAALDEAASMEHRPVSRALAREILKDEADADDD